MGLCVSLLAGLFADHIYFMSSLFLGLIVASIPFVAMAERDALRQWRLSPCASGGFRPAPCWARRWWWG